MTTDHGSISEQALFVDPSNNIYRVRCDRDTNGRPMVEFQSLDGSMRGYIQAESFLGTYKEKRHSP